MEHNPHSLANEQYEMSVRFAELSEELGALESKKAVAWLEARKECKTDREADRLIDASTEGQRATELRFLLKGIASKLSSAKALLRQLTEEARNLY